MPRCFTPARTELDQSHGRQGCMKYTLLLDRMFAPRDISHGLDPSVGSNRCWCKTLAFSMRCLDLHCLAATSSAANHDTVLMVGITTVKAGADARVLNTKSCQSDFRRPPAPAWRIEAVQQLIGDSQLNQPPSQDLGVERCSCCLVGRCWLSEGPDSPPCST